ncbi:MAG: hypothetical protein IJY22_05020 [Clostridia bacterium]|nr:hypothetical protein [Clostridia bacterium]
MIFFASNGQKRPIRLSEQTRQFAWNSLNRKYGRETKKIPAVAMDDIADFASLPAIKRYDLSIDRIVREAPLRICEGELISGAATLGFAIEHRVPATLGGKYFFGSISHLTVDFETVLKKGVDHIRREAEESLARHRGTDREPFLQSCLATLDAFRLWHGRYLEALAEMPEYVENYRALCHVPFAPATDFREAVQSIWFTFAFLRLCGNWPGIGRIDLLLGDYLKADLQAGKLTLDEAREILAHFFIKGCEWICGDNEFSAGSGDAQHYQNIVLCGIDREGNEVTNEVTYLVLDILEELPIGDFPTTVRVNRNTDDKLLRRVAEIMRLGGGVLAVYNEELVLEALRRQGYDPVEARSFANDGCWEVQIPGKTFFCYIPFDALQTLQHKTLQDYGEVDFDSFEALYDRYICDVKAEVESILQQQAKLFAGGVLSNTWKKRTPCTAVSLFEQGCIEKGLSYLEGGPVYNICSPHIGGLPDATNSLYAIKKLVYDEKKLTLPALLRILRNNWEGEESLRLYALRGYSYYGNDNDEVDLLAARILADFAEGCKALEGRCGYRFPPGVSTFGRQIEWAPHRLATPSGKKANAVLAANLSPTPGTDGAGATATIRSYCKADLAQMGTGAALDLKLLSTSTAGESGLDALISLIRGFVTLGGFFMQPDVMDTALLRAAQENPEEYSTLSVRVSGWNARFVTLNREWQEMVIAQGEHGS